MVPIQIRILLQFLHMIENQDKNLTFTIDSSPVYIVFRKKAGLASNLIEIVRDHVGTLL
jgi:hypothetical protein